MEIFYSLRCQITHSNLFTKDDYEKFESLSEEMTKVITEMINKIKKIKNIDAETTALLNEAPDELDSENPTYDILIVRAKPEGFEKVFLGENKWYFIRISDEKKE
ncbi:hypothetical protein [Facklamia miroungae]|nr:hypothetical protein [Facklamia miroungae]NKZ29443.1 hypothetical protein [Facklamia miroungae]